MFRSIKTKILVLQIGLVLSITIVLGTVSYFIMFQSVRANQQENLEHIAVNIGEKVNVLIAHKEQILEKTADSEVVANYFKKQQENVLVDYFGKFMPEFAALSYVNSSGIEEVKLVNGKTEASILNKSDSALIEQLKQTPNKVLNSYQPFSPETNGPCIEFGFLNMSFFDEFVGIILGKVSVVDMVESVQGFRLGQTGSAILLDSEGTILSCRDKNKILTKLTIEGTDAERVIAEIKAVKSGFSRATISGIDCYFAYAPVKGQNWLTITILPYKEFAAKLNTMKLISLLVGLIVLAIGVVLSSMLAVDITRPISKLTKATTIIAEGDFTQKIDIKSKDEIEILATSFNQMVEKLKTTTVSIEALRKEQARFKDVAESCGDWVWETDNQGRYVYSSNMVENILGYSPDEIIGKHFYDFFHPDDAEELKKNADRAFAAKESFLNLQNRNIRKDGKCVFLETTAVPILKGNGEFTGYRGIDRDITERKLAEEELLGKTALLEAQVNASLDGILVVDGNQKKIITNQRIADLFSVPQSIMDDEDDTALLKHVVSLTKYPEKFLEKVMYLYEHQNENSRDEIEFRNGMILDRYSAPVLGKNGQNYGRIWTFRDITERKQAEENMKKLNGELEQTVARLEETNQELKNFVYIASHDLREPLRKISAFGNMLQKSLEGKIFDDDAENMNFMIDGATRMSKMIEGLLVYSRVSTKAHSAEKVDLNDIVEQLSELELSVSIEEKNAAIEVPQPLPEVEADPVQIRQLMQNLISNGMKYQAKGNAPHITISSQPAADEMVRINIADNGIGIAPEFQQAIFVMFKRLHSKSEYEGTGIGLAVCKKIVTRHGGKIGVESQFGQGSTFWFTLPLATGKTEVAALPDNIASDKR